MKVKQQSLRLTSQLTRYGIHQPLMRIVVLEFLEPMGLILLMFQ